MPVIPQKEPIRICFTFHLDIIGSDGLDLPTFELVANPYLLGFRTVRRSHPGYGTVRGDDDGIEVHAIHRREGFTLFLRCLNFGFRGPFWRASPRQKQGTVDHRNIVLFLHEGRKVGKGVILFFLNWLKDIPWQSRGGEHPAGWPISPLQHE